jgi:hypothetical protein
VGVLARALAVMPAGVLLLVQETFWLGVISTLSPGLTAYESAL